MTAVEQLMGAYFHQDWDIDGGQVSDTVAAFLHEPRDTVLAAADQIDELIDMNLPEGGLAALLESMGCQYYAGESDGDYRQWLGDIQRQLRSFLATSAAS
ncbi:MAG TPA: contact-dependent growth inhibition system immunity protein [Nocardioides sp.]|nr:contact-dependent growth inhibition system immunity protein [Nocardioides sp.]